MAMAMSMAMAMAMAMAMYMQHMWPDCAPSDGAPACGFAAAYPHATGVCGEETTLSLDSPEETPNTRRDSEKTGP